MSDQTILRINGVDAWDLGIAVSELGDLWSPPSVSRETIVVPGRLGVYGDRVGGGRPKTVPISIALLASVADRRAALDTVLAHLDGLLELEWADAPGRVQYARIDTAAVSQWWDHNWRGWKAGDLEIVTQLVLDTPASFALGITSLGVTALPATIPLGTLPSEPVLYFESPTDLVVEVHHGLTGALMSVLTLDGLLAGAMLEVDSANESLVAINTTTGAREEVLGLYGSGDFPVYDPSWGDAANPPTLSANHDGVSYHRKVWA